MLLQRRGPRTNRNTPAGSATRTWQVARAALALLLAMLFLSVLAEPAAAAHGAPWRWKRVFGTGYNMPPGAQQEVTIFCPAGYRPVSLEWSAVGGVGFVVQANFLDYTGNWGRLLIYNPPGKPESRVVPVLNCVHGDDIGAVTTASVTLGRSGSRSGGWVDCPSGWVPLSFGADWEGSHVSKRIDFSSPTATGWYATGLDLESNTHLHLEVHCVFNSVFAGAQLVENQTTEPANQEVTLTAPCPAGKRTVGAGAFEYPVDGSVDPFNVNHGTTHSTTELLAAGSWGATVVATMPATGTRTWLVVRAWCVPASTPVLTVSAPSGTLHVHTISYSFSATDPVGESLFFSCSLDGDEAPCTPGVTNTVSGLSVGGHNLAIQVLNDSRMGDFEVHNFNITTAPDAPTVTGSTPSSGAVSVAFTTPSSNGDPITGYTAECASTDGGATGTGSVTSSPVQVSGLTNGRHYHCRVRATNGVGDSPYSGYDATVLVGAVPAGPTVTGSAPSSGSVSVTFTPGSDGGSPATGFAAECVSTDGGGTGTTSGAGSPLAVAGLTNGKHYRCHVRATNAVGPGDYGAYGATVLVADVPAGPTVTGSVASPGTVSVAFAPGGDGGSPVTGFTAECVSTDGGATAAASGGASPISVGALTKGKHYGCRVRATNTVGDGAFSALGPAVLTPDVPAGPTVTGSVPSPGTVSVAFIPGSDGGNPVTGFNAECVSTDGGVTASASGGASPISVGPLTKGKHYGCRVRATNAVGDGTFGGLGLTVLTPDVPGKPVVSMTKALSPTKLKVAAVVVETGGSPVTSFRVSCRSTNGGKPGKANGPKGPFRVKNLTPGKTYRCQVRGTNALGEGAWSKKGPKVTMPKAHPRGVGRPGGSGPHQGLDKGPLPVGDPSARKYRRLQPAP
jgi:predicted RNA-binding protein with TRAM domain